MLLTLTPDSNNKAQFAAGDGDAVTLIVGDAVPDLDGDDVKLDVGVKLMEDVSDGLGVVEGGVHGNST